VQTDEARRRYHYELEKRLARRILESRTDQRSQVTREAYDQLYTEITWHPGLHQDARELAQHVRTGLSLFNDLMPDRGVVVEIGCGTGLLAAELAARHPVTQVVATDISVQKLSYAVGGRTLGNLELMATEGIAIPFASGSVDFVYHHQVFEHFHPDDAAQHLREVFRVLRPGGIFAVDTPNRITGPWDVSQYYDDVATGFHLQEWTYRSLAQFGRRIGFRRIWSDAPFLGPVARHQDLSSLSVSVPVGVKVIVESALRTLPSRTWRRRFGKLLGINGVFVVMRK
jgi:SAM-dependent methyltransferase